MLSRTGTRYRTTQPASAACRGTVIGHPQSPKWTPKGAALRSSVLEKLESQLLPDRLRSYFFFIYSINSLRSSNSVFCPLGQATLPISLSAAPVTPLSGPVASSST
ncbi:uncharacterized protein BO96DRAFT_438865 [Aspergillus niger CBS 101883]|uniref:Contig An11c0380, genomic contig n=2 Tax=Aspergillus niger TaxID=5061 RepID=A2QY01_ASPNC|nr:uncharacterized protein BO96DRAFT_438865 [Aspergillus niger CBS 101883]XP_059601696.1 uncharacterized protein An11g10830 [Aspergillus niger]PYH51616.1 hypothetical protein BO96DRAFT_438865 [Aspergillus niger CBS 101883]CAK40881.1 unnamed protein product [Aspergillus niger]